MQLAKGSAEDLPSGLAANFRAFDFTRLSIERVVITDGFEKDVCLSSARRSRADLYQDKHTSNRQRLKKGGYVLKINYGKIEDLHILCYVWNICFIAHNYDFAVNAVHDVWNIVCPTFFHCSDNDFVRRFG